MMRTVVNDAWLLMMVLMMLTGRDDTVSGNGDAYGCYVERRVIVRLVLIFIGRALMLSGDIDDAANFPLHDSLSENPSSPLLSPANPTTAHSPYRTLHESCTRASSSIVRCSFV